MTPEILTNSGKYFNFLQPEDYDYNIEEIAHALSHVNRYSGHTRVPYNVADHALRVSYLVPPEFALDALCHDNSEAYLGDVASPLKQLLGDYKTIESKVEMAIAKHFNLRFPHPPCVKHADYVMLVTEKRDLLPFSEPWEHFKEFKPLKERIWPLKNREAREAFLARFYELTENK